MEHYFAPWWNFAIEVETTASASKTVFERIYAPRNMFRADPSIGIDENKDIAAGAFAPALRADLRSVGVR